MRLPRILLSLMVAAGTVGADRTDLGLAAVEVDAEGPGSCSSDPLCVVTWEPGEPATMGDDEFVVRQVIHEASLTARAPGPLPEQRLVLDPAALRLDHTAWPALKALWLQINDTLPPEARRLATLELGSHSLILFLHPPFPIPDPAGGEEYGRIGAPLPWDCSMLFADYAGWSDACTDEHLRPLPPGIASEDELDRAGEAVLWVASCEYGYEYYVPQACPSLDQGQGLASAGIESGQSFAPNLRWGFAVEELTAALEPLEGTAWARPGSPSPPALPTEDVHRTAAGVFDSSLLAATPALPGVVGPLSPRPWGTVPPSQETFAVNSALPADPLSSAGPLLVAATLGALLLAAALYHTITERTVLEQQTRRRVFEVIRADPGIRVGTVSMRLGLHYKTVHHHVRILAHTGLVEFGPGGQHRVFPREQGMGSHEKEAIIAASSPVARLLLARLSQGPAELGELCASLDMPKSTASMAVARMARAGVVSKHRVGTRLVVSLGRPPGVERSGGDPAAPS